MNCELCGQPMPAGEEMFKFHGYSGPCPAPPLPRRTLDQVVDELAQTIAHDLATLSSESMDDAVEAIRERLMTAPLRLKE